MDYLTSGHRRNHNRDVEKPGGEKFGRVWYDNVGRHIAEAVDEFCGGCVGDIHVAELSADDMEQLRTNVTKRLPNWFHADNYAIEVVCDNPSRDNVLSQKIYDDLQEVFVSDICKEISWQEKGTVSKKVAQITERIARERIAAAMKSKDREISRLWDEVRFLQEQNASLLKRCEGLQQRLQLKKMGHRKKNVSQFEDEGGFRYTTTGVDRAYRAKKRQHGML